MEDVVIRRNITVMGDSDIMKAMDITEQIASEMGFLPRECLFLRLATEEACMNAYEYCQKTNQLPFEVFWTCEKEKLMIVVKQHGKKFDITRRDVVNKGLRGRGLQLIIHIVDHVYLEQKGNNVLFYMCKYKDH
ncbi:ATP-binding protein [Parageobacillus thermoglucosidasius]|jgi:serine/threonine-protein kinase RsbW|uniref:Anti-sigma regulatory factor n=1 Tax=Parageobacillus thermoglucosidasius TaxID=1426 RepID=A0AAN0YRG9_PARTM|nr:ATP-binding protein [Parageobacillus thermoglucosidasius]AEH49354.1 putative anti-sigma regulatory factor, serine/threonine protein kinase [Parageobacillus thermoglucosidasius C56-YS93]ALF09485.1 anti-sigma regulatory factor [Parageobacillus thermoglucosidasius]ANZ29568.1 anti-sigma regulatory factor [Parageobacillus thermoglucosidasius]APM80306.1 anti-sigma regulatory factor [Parageobacillus thermoglucosidasius]KJX70153.1 anti-sigma regulatory factor [Parageobacillus thermoglucosidasius]